MQKPLQVRQLAGCALLTLIVAVSGCEGGPAAVLTSMRPASGASDGELAIKHREAYQTDRDPEAIDWLLANKVRQGMSANEVGEVLGQDGEREYQDRKLKASDSTYRSTDVAYRWGPDRSGRTIILLFREGRLLNFDPRQFAADAAE